MRYIKPLLAYISIFVLITFAILTYKDINYIVVSTFILITLICTYETFSSKNVIYGTSQIFYIFCLFFLGIAPLFQYLTGVTLWGGEPFDETDYIKTNLLILSALICYKYIYTKTLIHKYKLKFSHFFETKHSMREKQISTISLIIISTVASIYIFIIFGADVSTLLLRGKYAESKVAASGGLTYLLNSFFFRPIPAICLLLFKYYKKKKILAEIFLLFLMLFTNAPTGMPRFAVAAFYIPLVFLYLKSLKMRHNFALMMVFAVVVVFPILNTFRMAAEGQIISLNMFLAGHFDSYQMFMRVVSTNYITYGYQLLGVFLFFVPRSLWSSKPIGSGYLIAHENNYYFDNLSMNFFGEGYINFGILGVIIFAVIIAYINARLDRKYWFEGGMHKPLFALIFFISIGMEFAIMRGALLNIFPLLIGYIFVTIIVNYISTISFKNKH